MISLVAAAIFTGIGLALKSKLQLRGWILLVTPLVLLAGLLFAGFDAVYDRMAQLQQIRDDARWKMIAGTLDAWRHYPVWGTGLGTHEFVFPMFDPATDPSMAAHADCDYAQLLEETGVVGMGLIGAFLLGFWWRYGQLVRRRVRSVAMAAFGLGFGLLAVMIHSATDFGQHLPANFCLTAIFCGLLVAIGRIERRYAAGSGGRGAGSGERSGIRDGGLEIGDAGLRKEDASRGQGAGDGQDCLKAELRSEAETGTDGEKEEDIRHVVENATSHTSPKCQRGNDLGPSHGLSVGVGRSREPHRQFPLGRRMAGAIALTGLVTLWGCVLWEVNAVRVSEQYWEQTAMAESRVRQWNWQASDEDYMELIAAAAASAQWQPDNIKPRYWMNLYRWYSISRVVDAETGRVIWHPQAVHFAERIAGELSQARLICPTFGPIYSFEGQLRLLFLGQPGGADLIRKGYQLVPHDASTCFIAGVLSAREGKLEEATTRFRRAVALDDAFFAEIVHIYVDELNRPELAVGLVEGELPEGVSTANEPAGDESAKDRLLREGFFRTRCRRLLTIIKILSSTEEDACMAAAIRHETVAMLRVRCQAEDVTVEELVAMADISRDAGQYAAAADYYRRALGFNFDQVDWRCSLAQSLADLGDWEEADHQARICLRLAPGTDAAVKLVQKLSVQAKPDDAVE